MTCLRANYRIWKVAPMSLSIPNEVEPLMQLCVSPDAEDEMAFGIFLSPYRFLSCSCVTAELPKATDNGRSRRC